CVPAEAGQFRQLLEAGPRRDIEVTEIPGETHNLPLTGNQPVVRIDPPMAHRPPSPQPPSDPHAVEQGQDAFRRVVIREERERGDVPPMTLGVVGVTPAPNSTRSVSRTPGLRCLMGEMYARPPSSTRTFRNLSGGIDGGACLEPRGVRPRCDADRFGGRARGGAACAAGTRTPARSRPTRSDRRRPWGRRLEGPGPPRASRSSHAGGASLPVIIWILIPRPRGLDGVGPWDRSYGTCPRRGGRRGLGRASSTRRSWGR